MPTEVVMATLASLGEYVGSPAAKIEEPVLRQVYARLGAEYGGSTSRPPPPWDRKGRAPERRENAERAREAGVQSERRNWYSRPDGEWWDRRDDASPAWEMASWTLFHFTEFERDAWISHGLRPGQVKDAATYRDAGFQPGDLVRDVYGWTVLRRLRSGELPSDVYRLLRASTGEEQTA